MTEGDARAFIVETYGYDKAAVLDDFVDALLQANKSQNLISRTSEATIWNRHILDSAQICAFAPKAGAWLDIGSGAGLPGIVLAILTAQPVTLVEPRRKRIEFLRDIAARLSLSNVTLHQAEIERVRDVTFDVVTARAFAPLPDLFSAAFHLTKPATTWILPKGRSAQQELAAAQHAWQGMFHVEHSLTDDDARIVVATGVRPR